MDKSNNYSIVSRMYLPVISSASSRCCRHSTRPPKVMMIRSYILGICPRTRLPNHYVISLTQHSRKWESTRILLETVASVPGYPQMALMPLWSSGVVTKPITHSSWIMWSYWASSWRLVGLGLTLVVSRWTISHLVWCSQAWVMWWTILILY